MKALLLIAAITLATSATAQVLQESSTDLGHGFKAVSRSQVNPPGHWEGVGHFSFLYYGGKQLCQCSRSGFSISPGGRHVLHLENTTGHLVLFTPATGTSREVPDAVVGSLGSVEWHEARQQVKLEVYQLVNGKEERSTLSVELE